MNYDRRDTPIITPKPPVPNDKPIIYTISAQEGERASRRAALKEVQRLIREFGFTLEEINGT